MNILGIVQARMVSIRCAGKVLANLHGKPMLEHLMLRLSASKKLDRLVVATTEESDDDVLVKWCLSNNINVFRGSSENVLSRFYNCALNYNADIIVRITADDPLKDPEIIDRAIDIITEDPELDYVSNTIIATYPEGIDVEVFRFSALKKAYKSAVKKSDLEHVTPFIWSKPDIFGLFNFYAEEDMSEFRLTVDYKEDLELVTEILSHFKDKPLVSYIEIVKFLRSSPNVTNINSGILRNEGYVRSLIDEE